MIRLTSLLTIALGIVFCLTISTADARGKYSRSNCESRIFKKDENLACFGKNGDPYIFEKRAQPDALVPAPTSGFTLSSPVGRFVCGCQLRSKYSIICADSGAALIGSVDSRGRKLVGEAFAAGNGQQKIQAYRTQCAPAPVPE